MNAFEELPEELDEKQELAQIDTEEYLAEIHETFGTPYKGPRGFVGTKDEATVSMMLQATRFKKTEQIRKRAEIRREYVMTGNELLLKAEVDITDLSNLITIFTKDTAEKIEHVRKVLTSKIEKFLKSHIPYELKASHSRYPQAFIKHPGFMYISSEYYGGYKLWIDLNIPYFFAQFSELQIISADEALKTSLDKLVEQYYILKAKLSKDEINLAIKFDKVKTRDNLLEMNIMYYEEYMKMLKERNEK